jgi:hypothetical protein
VRTDLRILVVGSCSKGKLKQYSDAPTCGDLESKESLIKWQSLLSNSVVKAREMYTGRLNQELVKGVDLLRQIKGLKIQLHIVSAGFGIVNENELIPPYDCSFSGMRKHEILARADNLKIEYDFAQICSAGFDIIYLAVGKNYLIALGDEWKSVAESVVIGFDKKLAGPRVFCAPSDYSTVSAFSSRGYIIHGVVGFKGDLLRILAQFALCQDDPYHEVMRWTKSIYFQHLLNELGGL